MQLESRQRAAGPGVDRGRQPVQQLGHMLSVDICHGVQALHLTQAMYAVQGLERKREREQ